MLVDIDYNEISEAQADLTRGRIEDTVIPRPGVKLEPGKSKYSLPSSDLMAAKIYIPYTASELDAIEAKQLAEDKDSMLLEVMYQVMRLTDMIQGGSQ